MNKKLPNPGVRVMAGFLLCTGTSYANDVSPQRDDTGWYLTAGVGASWATPINLTKSTSFGTLPNIGNVGAAINGTENLGSGAAVDGGFGYKFKSNIRAELTYSFNTFTTGNLTFNGAGTGAITLPISGTGNISGNINRNSVFSSIYYDIPTNSKWAPYIGGGIGWSYVSISNTIENYNFTLPILGAVNYPATARGGGASAFGYQAKLGISYLASKRSDIYVEGVYSGNTPVSIGSSGLGSLNDFGFKVGFRYRLGKQ